MSYEATHITLRQAIEVVVEEQDGAVSAYAPGAPGVYAAGATRSEVERLVLEALELAFATTAAVDGPALAEAVAHDQDVARK